MKARSTVYIETTIPSYYHETRTTPWVRVWRAQTRRWWRYAGPQFELVTSEYVAAELKHAPEHKRAAAEQLVRGLPFLEINDRIEALSRYYIDQLVMPDDGAGDAGHLAVASAYGVDYLLTWNCRHLANANKFRHIQVVNDRLGLHTPMIVTPLQLMPE
ncbi:MAG: type II toxin-antitoxin system VapC family toxin [Phycisphaerales bacterium]